MNKDILYYYTTYERRHVVGFLYKNSYQKEGWSMYLNTFNPKGWEWTQTSPYNGSPVGHRCLLQW